MTPEQKAELDELVIDLVFWLYAASNSEYRIEALRMEQRIGNRYTKLKEVSEDDWSANYSGILAGYCVCGKLHGIQGILSSHCSNCFGYHSHGNRVFQQFYSRHINPFWFELAMLKALDYEHRRLTRNKST